MGHTDIFQSFQTELLIDNQLVKGEGAAEPI